MLCVDRRPVQRCTTWGSQHLQVYKIVYTILCFFVLCSSMYYVALTNSILNEVLQNRNAFLTGIVTEQHLLEQTASR